MSAPVAPTVRRFLAALFLAAWAVLASAAPAWLVSVDTQQGLPVITRGGAPALNSPLVFWGANWGWADTPTQFKIASPYTYTVTGHNAVLGFDLTSNVRRTSDKEMVWDIDLNAASTIANVIGGGISFKFNTALFGTEMGNPVILPGNVGWAWGPVGGSRIEMRFNPAPANIYIEPGSRNELRAFFYNGSVPAGHTRTTATLTLAGGMSFAPTQLERFGLVDPTTWPADIMDWRTSPVDLSFLNRPEIPAGKRGFLRAVRDQLVFQDGSVARFWGANIAAYSLFSTSKDGIRQQARRLSQLGFNLVRIHHHDSPWVNPNIFGSTTAADTLTLSPASLDKLDWWIKCLKDEGIYVWLDLHVMRYLKAGDRIDNFSEMAKGKPDADLRGYNFVNGSIQRAMRDFNRAYLEHLNGYTNLRYRDDPAIIGLLVTNENDATSHFGNSLLPDKNVPQHNAIYMAESNKFANTWGLSKDATWHSWEYGPSKLFLNDLEYRFGAGMINDLRSNGAKVPIATTSSWGGAPLSSLPALTAGGLTDAHSYGRVGEIDQNPVYAANLVKWIAAAQIAGRPLTVTEWNVEPFPVPDRHSLPLYVASNASLQGWDALMLYAYAQVAIDSISVPSNWHAYNDPALIATLPAAALLYRQGHVRESETVYAFTPTPQQLFGQRIAPDNSIALRTASEKGKLVIAMPATRELPWLPKSTLPANATLVTDPQKSLIAPDATVIASDTGQLRRDWDQGIYTINTPRTQAAMGWIGGRSIQLPDVNISVSTRNATVAVQTLDGQPVSNSRNMMISLGARSIPVANKTPFYSEPVEGRVTIRGPTGLRLYKKRPDGTDQEVPVAYSNGSYILNLDASLRSYWLVLK